MITATLAQSEMIRSGIRDQERRLEKRVDLLDQQLDLINERGRGVEAARRVLAEQKDEVLATRREVDRILSEQRDLLERLGRLTTEQAREHLLREVEGELSREYGEMILRWEAGFREDSQRRAREILGTAAA